MKKILTYSFIAVAVVGILAIGVMSIRAENTDNNYPPIIQKIAERFNLNIDEVKEVFDEARQERHQKIQTHFEGKLDKFVAKDKLSEEQKEAVLAKMKEMREEYRELKSLSPKERHAKMMEIKEEMKTWTEENGINLGLLKGFNKGFGKGFGLKAFRQRW